MLKLSANQVPIQLRPFTYIGEYLRHQHYPHSFDVTATKPAMRLFTSVKHDEARSTAFSPHHSSIKQVFEISQKNFYKKIKNFSQDFSQFFGKAEKPGTMLVRHACKRIGSLG
jgi:hypothetical protein